MPDYLSMRRSRTMISFAAGVTLGAVLAATVVALVLQPGNDPFDAYSDAAQAELVRKEALLYHRNAQLLDEVVQELRRILEGHESRPIEQLASMIEERATLQRASAESLQHAERLLRQGVEEQ